MTYAELLEWGAYDRVMQEKRDEAKMHAENKAANQRVLSAAMKGR